MDEPVRPCLQGQELTQDWLALPDQMAFLMALRAMCCLGNAAAGTDGHKKTAAIYVQVGKAALQESDATGVTLAPDCEVGLHARMPV